MSFAALKRWSRSSSARFALLFLLLFGTTSAGLMAFVYHRATSHFDAQTDEWLARECRLMTKHAGRAASIDRVVNHNESDINHLRPFGLFDASGHSLAGQIKSLPAEQRDGVAFELNTTTLRGPAKLRAMTRTMPGGDRFLAAQDMGEATAFAHDLVAASACGGLAMLAVGLVGTLILAAGQERRVRRLTGSLHQIMAGRLGERLAPSPRRDELDDLTSEVNRMLEELQRLMLEVKSAGDNIAHDMRTPLTRLLANLRRVNREDARYPEMASVIDEAVNEVNGMIGMFNALLRIAEIDEGARRQGFRRIDLARVVEDVADFHEVAAIERGITITRALPDRLVFEGDADLLFEAVGNLVDNAIKYTPSGGRITVRLEDGPVLTVADNGPGIPRREQTKVLQRFHRVEASRSLPGNGLGLALVSAIARLHRLDFRIGDGVPGCVATLGSAG